MTATILVAGVSHSRTPARMRERLHLAADAAAALSRSLAREGREAVVLATCSRTELYLTGAGAEHRARLALAELSGYAGEHPGIYAHADEDVAHHLFRVTAGLESIVVGDTHVAAQVRRAHRAARAAGATGPLLDRLFEAASGASKRVRSQTAVSSGSASIPAAAIATAADTVGSLSGRRVVVVGAGKIAQLAALGAWSRGCRDITVANRTVARAQKLAERIGGRAVPLDRLGAELATADVVVTATAGRDFVVTADCLGHEAPLAIFDLALPRDVDPSVRHVSQLFDLDDLARIVAATGVRRHAELERAGAIVREEAARYDSWRRVREVAPAISALREDAEQTRRGVLARHATELARLTSDEREVVETITTQLVGRLVHAPTLELRRQALERSA